MEALWATILFSGFALEVIIRQGENCVAWPAIPDSFCRHLFPGRLCRLSDSARARICVECERGPGVRPFTAGRQECFKKLNFRSESCGIQLFYCLRSPLWNWSFSSFKEFCFFCCQEVVCEIAGFCIGSNPGSLRRLFSWIPDLLIHSGIQEAVFQSESLKNESVAT